MKRTAVSLFLAFGYLAGCGTSASTPTGSQSAAQDYSQVADSASDSADLAASFGAETTGFELTTSSLGVESVPSEENLRAGAIKPGLELAFWAVAADPKLCTSGSATVTPGDMNSPSCNTLPAFAKSSTVVVTDCALPNGGKLSGTITTNLDKALATGQSCTAGATINVTHQITFSNVSYQSPSNYVLAYPTFTATVTGTHAIGAPPAMVSVNYSGERSITDPSGKLILHQMLSGSPTVTFTAGASGAAPSRTLNGNVTVVHELLHYTATAALAGVERVNTCCKPIAGTITITAVPTQTPPSSSDMGSAAGGGTSVTATFSYGPSCGQVSYNGKPLTVAECL